MEPMSTAALIQAGGSLLSGVSGFFGKKQSTSDMLNAQKNSLYINHRAAEDLARDLPLAQKEGFERAGIHPVYGFSGGAAQFSPSVSVGGVGEGTTGSNLAQMGNGISRAAEALISERERLQNRLLESQIQGADIDNQKKASDLAITQAALPPGLGATSQSPVEMFSRQPKTDRSVAAGDIADVQFAVGRKGSRIPVPSAEMADSMDVDVGILPNLTAGLWALRNQIAPNFGLLKPPSQDQLPEGYKWGWSVASQAYIPVRIRKKSKPRFQSSRRR